MIDENIKQIATDIRCVISDLTDTNRIDGLRREVEMLEMTITMLSLPEQAKSSYNGYVQQINATKTRQENMYKCKIADYVARIAHLNDNEHCIPTVKQLLLKHYQNEINHLNDLVGANDICEPLSEEEYIKQRIEQNKAKLETNKQHLDEAVSIQNEMYSPKFKETMSFFNLSDIDLEV